jgi:hypothetical protein
MILLMISYLLMLGILLFQSCIIVFAAMSFLFPKIDMFFKTGVCFATSILFVLAISIGNYSFMDRDFFVYIGIVTGSSIAALKNKNSFTTDMGKSGMTISSFNLMRGAVVFSRLILYSIVGGGISYFAILFTSYFI